jgi:hypothetical protein
MLFARFVGDGRKRIEADVIAGPAWTLEGRAFSTAVCAAGAGTQFVVGLAEQCSFGLVRSSFCVMERVPERRFVSAVSGPGPSNCRPR